MMEKIGPYRVEEQIGVGGMGEVYKAYDDRLDRWVAIKRIRDDKEQGEENRERFQREARATAKLNHSSIVHLYDIFRDGGNDCIVMEFVEGMTLDKLIRNGPLEPVMAARLGHEIASGLAEAHAKGIIHRDLKVENVIVTPEGHAKILDFGLARPLLNNELDASLTGKGQLVGTSRAMSPEYVGGEDIDHRSDLFSLGVLLYEMVTSHSPFKAHNTLATLKQVMLHRQTPAHLVNDNVPEEFSSVIENLLEKDPEDRPQDALEVSHELGQISGSLSSGDVSRPTLPGNFSTTPTEVMSHSATSVDIWSLRKWLVLTAILMAVGTYFLTRWWLAKPDGDPPIQGMETQEVDVQKARILLADFQNRTGEPVLDDSIELAFRLGLEQSQHASFLSPSQIQRALTLMQREGVGALVVGGIGKVGDTYTVTAEVVDPQDGVTTYSTQETADNQDGILKVLDTVTEGIRIHLGESLAAIEETRRPLEKVTTKDLEALKAYSLGVKKIPLDQYSEAIQLLNLAIEIDSEFAMAYAKLATVYTVANHDDAKILATLERALSLSDRLTDFEKLYVEGWVARFHGETDKMISTWSVMSTLYEDFYPGHFNLGASLLVYLEDFENASRAFEKAVRVASPEDLPVALSLLGQCQIALEQFDKARSSFGRLTGEGLQQTWANLYLAEGNYPELEAVVEELARHPRRSIQVDGRLLQAQVFADSGEYQRALLEARQAYDLAVKEEGLGSSVLTSGLTVAALHKYLGAESEMQQALAAFVDNAKKRVNLEQGSVDSSPVRELALAGKLAARSGDVGSAVAIDDLISPLLQKAPIAAWRGDALMLQGEILAAQGRGRQAIARFEDARAIIRSFQIHESLAYHYQNEGLIEEAISESEWLVRHRGRTVVDAANGCIALNLMDWATAIYRLGVLKENSGDLAAATGYYQRLVSHWSKAEQHPIRQELISKLDSRDRE